MWHHAAKYRPPKLPLKRGLTLVLSYGLASEVVIWVGIWNFHIDRYLKLSYSLASEVVIRVSYNLGWHLCWHLKLSSGLSFEVVIWIGIWRCHQGCHLKLSLCWHLTLSSWLASEAVIWLVIWSYLWVGIWSCHISWHLKLSSGLASEVVIWDWYPMVLTFWLSWVGKLTSSRLYFFLFYLKHVYLTMIQFAVRETLSLYETGSFT
jgi:hypothetical protein